MRKPVFASGNGNTFLIFDCRDQFFSRFQMLIWFICKKVDSCLVLFPGVSGKSTDLALDVYFPKGGFCGNGARVLAHYLHQHPKSSHIVGKFSRLNQFRIIDPVCLNLINFNAFYGFEFECSQISILNHQRGYYVQAFTEPHYVSITTQPSLQSQTRSYINSNYCYVLDDHTFYVKTWERGICRWTLSCGTGIISCFKVLWELGKIKFNNQDQIYIWCDGGRLIIQRLTQERLIFYGQTYVQFH